MRKMKKIKSTIHASLQGVTGTIGLIINVYCDNVCRAWCYITYILKTFMLFSIREITDFMKSIRPLLNSRNRELRVHILADFVKFTKKVVHIYFSNEEY